MANPNRSPDSTAQEQCPHHQKGVVVHHPPRRPAALRRPLLGPGMPRAQRQQGKRSEGRYERFRIRLHGGLRGEETMKKLWLL